MVLGGALPRGNPRSPVPHTPVCVCTQRHKKLLNILGVDQITSQLDVLMELCQHMTLEAFPPNAVVMRQGQAARACYVVLSGSCDVYRLGDPTQPAVREHSLFVRDPAPSEEPAPPNFTSLLNKLMHLSATSKQQTLGPAPPDPAAKRVPDRGRTPRSRVATAPATAPAPDSEEPGAGLHVTVPPMDRGKLGEHLVTAEEGDVIGELALFRDGCVRAATVVANGCIASPQHARATRGSAVMEDTLLVEISKQGPSAVAVYVSCVSCCARVLVLSVNV